MDLVEQIGRRFQKPEAGPLEPPLPIVPPSAREDGSVPLVVKNAGPGAGFKNRPTGQARPPSDLQATNVSRHPGPPPGFEPRQPPRQPAAAPWGFHQFPHHIPATRGLFGAVATPWTLSRAESEEGIRRSLSHPSQPRPQQNDPNEMGISNLSMSRSASHTSHSRPYPLVPGPRDPLQWPVDYRDDLFLLAGRDLPTYY
jgi:hypothetical protein